MKRYQSPWSISQIDAISPEIRRELLYFLVLGQESIKYNTGVEYKRNDYVYSKFGVINSQKDDVTFLGLEIHRDFSSPPLPTAYVEIFITN